VNCLKALTVRGWRGLCQEPAAPRSARDGAGRGSRHPGGRAGRSTLEAAEIGVVSR